MMSIRPFLFATLPTYLLFASMILSAMGIYDLSQAVFNNPFPSPTPGVPGLVYFALFTVSLLIELEVYSKLMDWLQLRDIRVPLPRHWRLVILDMISWFDVHKSWEPGMVLGGIVTVCGLGGAVIYAMQVIHASFLAFLAVGFAGLFVVFFGLGVGQVLIRSTVSPLGTLSDEEQDELLSALPKLTRDSIEYLKRNRTFVPSAKAKRVSTILFIVAFGAFGASLASMYWDLAPLKMPLAYLGALAANIGIILIGFPISGSKISSLSRILNRSTDESERV